MPLETFAPTPTRRARDRPSRPVLSRAAVRALVIAAALLLVAAIQSVVFLLTPAVGYPAPPPAATRVR